MWVNAVLFALLSVASCSPSRAETLIHRKPTPSLPQNFNPRTSIDNFSINAVLHIHRSLFKLKANVPQPDLIESFDVSKDQLHVSLKVKGAHFHDGQMLTAKVSVASIESSIKSRTPGFENLSPISGFSQFLAGKTEHLAGLKVNGERDFSIGLDVPAPKLLTALSEYRFAIIPDNGDGRIGLGPYKIESADQIHVVLTHAEPLSFGVPEKIEYIKADENAALAGFDSGQFHDLFAYTITKEKADKLTKNAHIARIYSPRIYFFAINPRKVITREARSALMKQINREQLIGECYPSNRVENSVVPAGFLGYSNGIRIEADQNRVSENLKLKIGVANGIGSDSCVLAQLRKQLGKTDLLAELLDTDTILQAWSRGQIDAFFAYIEADDTPEFFHLFNPNSSFNLGAPDDTQIEPMLKAYLKISKPELRHEQAVKLNAHIIRQKVILPIFSPETFLVYSNRYSRVQLGTKSVNFLAVSELRLNHAQ